jgi:hypothetical protein
MISAGINKKRSIGDKELKIIIEDFAHIDLVDCWIVRKPKNRIR